MILFTVEEKSRARKMFVWKVMSGKIEKMIFLFWRNSRAGEANNEVFILLCKHLGKLCINHRDRNKVISQRKGRRREIEATILFGGVRKAGDCVGLKLDVSRTSNFEPSHDNEAS